MKKGDNLFWSIMGLLGLIYCIYTDPLLFCQMDYINGRISFIQKSKFPWFEIDGIDYKFESKYRQNDSIVRQMHCGDSVEVWFYKIPDPGSYQWGHFFGKPYDYLVTQLKVNGEMKIEYSFMLGNWLFSLFLLFVSVFNAIRFIQKTKNKEKKDKVKKRAT